MLRSFLSRPDGSAFVDLFFDLKLERMPDGVVRVYAPDQSGALHVFQSRCDGPECCDGCLIETARDGFGFAIGEELAKAGIAEADVSAVLRLNGVPFVTEGGV